jgi:hypothetical protein
MEKGSTITAKYNIENSLKPVIEILKNIPKKDYKKTFEIFLLQQVVKANATLY